MHKSCEQFHTFSANSFENIYVYMYIFKNKKYAQLHYKKKHYILGRRYKQFLLYIEKKV